MTNSLGNGTIELDGHQQRDQRVASRVERGKILAIRSFSMRRNP
jgi:hypothetical protein